MKIRVLGAAAGGGFPQWNCNCRELRRRPPGHVACARPDPIVDRRLAATASARGRSSMHRPTSSRNSRPTRRFNPAARCATAPSPASCWSTGRSITRPACTCCASRRAPGRSGAPTARYADLTRGNPVLEVLAHFCGVRSAVASISTARHFASTASTDVRWRALAGRQASRRLLAQPRVTGSGRQHRAGDHGRTRRSACVCAGARRDGRSRLALHAIAPPA